jgi:hypothetical protein
MRAGAGIEFCQERNLSNSGCVHPFIGSLIGLKVHEEPQANNDSTPNVVFLHSFTKVTQLLTVEKTELHVQFYLDYWTS